MAVAGAFLAAFIWAVKSGQFDDTSTPPLRLLTDDSVRTERPASAVNKQTVEQP